MGHLGGGSPRLVVSLAVRPGRASATTWRSPAALPMEDIILEQLPPWQQLVDVSSPARAPFRRPRERMIGHTQRAWCLVPRFHDV